MHISRHLRSRPKIFCLVMMLPLQAPGMVRIEQGLRQIARLQCLLRNQPVLRELSSSDVPVHIQRSYSCAVHVDQEGNGPTSAAARHKCRAGQLFQLRTGNAQIIRQEGTASVMARVPSASANRRACNGFTLTKGYRSPNAA